VTFVVAALLAGSLPVTYNGPALTAALIERPEPRAVEGGGYSAGEILTFMTSGDGDALTTLSSVTHCGRASASGPVTIEEDGSFAFRFGSSVSVNARGAFVDPKRAEGTIRVRGPRCDTGPVRFLAMLS
jgi:hypothetical protein